MLDYKTIDWLLLASQKEVLVDTIDRLPRESNAAGSLVGILHLVDAIQDDAVDNEGFKAENVFTTI